MWQPRKGRWVKAGPDLVLDGSPLPRWVPLALLALLALADALCQLAARAVLAAPWWHVPEDWAAFARDVLGIATHPGRRELAARLLRPLAVLACLAVYRWLFALGTLRRQLEGQVLGPEGVERERLNAQYGLLGFLKRLLILHASKLIVVACFAASMQLPGAIGALIICELFDLGMTGGWGGQRNGLGVFRAFLCVCLVGGGRVHMWVPAAGMGMNGGRSSGSPAKPCNSEHVEDLALALGHVLFYSQRTHTAHPIQPNPPLPTFQVGWWPSHPSSGRSAWRRARRPACTAPCWRYSLSRAPGPSCSTRWKSPGSRWAL